MVKVTAIDTPSGKQVRWLGFLRGQFSIPDDFNTMCHERMQNSRYCMSSID